jgi:hypothetical protein
MDTFTLFTMFQLWGMLSVSFTLALTVAVVASERS